MMAYLDFDRPGHLCHITWPGTSKSKTIIYLQST